MRRIIGPMGVGGVLLAAWLALRLGLGVSRDPVDVLAIVGIAFVMLGVRNRARRELVGTGADRRVVLPRHVVPRRAARRSARPSDGELAPHGSRNRGDLERRRHGRG